MVAGIPIGMQILVIMIPLSMCNFVLAVMKPTDINWLKVCLLAIASVLMKLDVILRMNQQIVQMTYFNIYSMVSVCLILLVFNKVLTSGKLNMENVNVLNMLNFLQERLNVYVNMVMITIIYVFHYQNVLKMNKLWLMVKDHLDIIMDHISLTFIHQILMIV